LRADDSAAPVDRRSLTTLGTSMTLEPLTHCDMNGALSSIERAIVAALVSAIVKELQT
jgi:hypothetical protein